MNGTSHREVGEYLRRLERAMDDVPDDRRNEILSEIDEHIAELLTETAAASDADVRNVLERVGDPEDIAAEARERFVMHPVVRSGPTRATWTDVATIVLLVLGSLMITPFYRPEGLFVAWIAAIVLMWMSDVWSVRDKIGVTLILPSGLLSAIAINGSGDEGFLYFGVILFASIWPPVHLGLKLRRARLASEHRDVALQNGGSAGSGTSDRSSRWWIVGVAALIVAGATSFALFPPADGGEDLVPTGEGAPVISESQFDQVALGDSKDDVARALGGPGETGSIVAGLDPIAIEQPSDVGDQQFTDCWSYPVLGRGGSDAAVCFDPSDEVAYTRVRIR